MYFSSPSILLATALVAAMPSAAWVITKCQSSFNVGNTYHSVWVEQADPAVDFCGAAFEGLKAKGCQVYINSYCNTEEGSGIYNLEASTDAFCDLNKMSDTLKEITGLYDPCTSNPLK